MESQRIREMHQKISKIVVYFFAFFALLSCDTSLRHEEFEEINVEGWNYKDAVSFQVPIDAETTKHIVVAVRNTADYQKANVWLFLSVTSPSGMVLKDTLDCPLADDFGYWLGDGFMGLYLTKHSVHKPILFDEEGDWDVKITHGMRQDTIKGISEVGILIKEVEK